MFLPCPFPLETVHAAFGAEPRQVFGLEGILVTQIPRVPLPSLARPVLLNPRSLLPLRGSARITPASLLKTRSDRVTLDLTQDIAVQATRQYQILGTDPTRSRPRAIMVTVNSADFSGEQDPAKGCFEVVGKVAMSVRVMSGAYGT